MGSFQAHEQRLSRAAEKSVEQALQSKVDAKRNSEN